MTSLTARLALCYTGVVHDVMRGMKFSSFTLPKDIRPMIPEAVLAGPVFTVAGHPAPGADAHETLVAWIGLLSQAPGGHIWVSQPNDDTVAHMGRAVGRDPAAAGRAGVVTDGAIRDVRFLLDLGFPCWSRGFTPRDIVGAWMPEATNLPIVIGDVSIRATTASATGTAW
jgi:4-hydroxy-4-methyl-2-oxoglutarate aldolase